MRALPQVPAFRLGVFTSVEAAAAGWTRSALAAAVHRGALVRVRRGCWAPALDPSAPGSRAVRTAQLAVAASLAAPDTAVSHLAAATVWGLPTWAPTARACVTEWGRRRADLDGVHRHRAKGSGIARHGGVLVTDPARTVFDIAREHGAEAALVVADAALRTGLVDGTSLFSAGLSCRGWPGARTARLVGSLADPLAESPLESRSRWRMRHADLPEPRQQVSIHALTGEFLGRVDFYWEEGVVGEADGDLKYDSPEALRREKWRQEGLERCELGVVRWGTRDLVPFDPTAERLRRALARARARPGPRLWVARYAHPLHHPPAW